MKLLKFDELNKSEEFLAWIDGMKPSEIMDNKQQVADRCFDLLEYLYMLGYYDARDELGEIADYALPFLPEDYVPQEEELKKIVEQTKPKDYDEAKEQSINRSYDGKDAYERVMEYAELGEAENIKRVVETDGHRIYNDGGFIGAKGIAKRKVWTTMKDDRVRDTHDYLDGMSVGMDERFFTYDGDSAMYPGDFSLVENNANCRCWITYQREL